MSSLYLSIIYVIHLSICRWKWSVHPYIYDHDLCLATITIVIIAIISEWFCQLDVSQCCSRFCFTKSLYPYNRPLFDPSFHIVVSFAPVLVEIWTMINAKRNKVWRMCVSGWNNDEMTYVWSIILNRSHTIPEGKQRQLRLSCQWQTRSRLPSRCAFFIFQFRLCLMMRKNSRKFYCSIHQVSDDLSNEVKSWQERGTLVHINQYWFYFLLFAGAFLSWFANTHLRLLFREAMLLSLLYFSTTALPMSSTTKKLSCEPGTGFGNYQHYMRFELSIFNDEKIIPFLLLLSDSFVAVHCYDRKGIIIIKLINSYDRKK